MVPDVHVSVVQRRQHPWLGGVDVDAFDAVRAGSQLPLDVEPQRLETTARRG